MKIKHLLASIVAGTLLSSAASADILGVNLAESPDIVSEFINVNYDAGSDILTANGFAFLYDNDGVGSAEMITDGAAVMPTGGAFTLNAIIDDLGTLTSGTVSIFGDIDSLGITDATDLITGTLTAVGAVATTDNDIIDFLFTVTGGELAAAFGGIGATAGIIMTNTEFADWGASFNNFMAVADTAALPASEPGILALQGLGLLMLVWLRRRNLR